MGTIEESQVDNSANRLKIIVAENSKIDKCHVLDNARENKLARLGTNMNSDTAFLLSKALIPNLGR